MQELRQSFFPFPLVSFHLFAAADVVADAVVIAGVVAAANVETSAEEVAVDAGVEFRSDVGRSFGERS